MSDSQEILNNIQPSLDVQLHNITTMIECRFLEHYSQGSGFFYTQLSPPDITKKGLQWRRVEKTWLVTNRHVALFKNSKAELIPDNLTFNLREVIEGKIVWFPITIPKDDLLKRLKLHNSPDVDIALIDISDLIFDITLKLSQEDFARQVIIPSGLTNDNLPNVSPLTIEITSDIVVASYPRGFYDEYNKYPIVKSGIVASVWNCHFQGKPLFLIDAQLFPGSSGGLVISKPTNIAVIDGSIACNETKQYVLLGVYSGEPIFPQQVFIDDMTITKHTSYGLGNVWYSYLIEEIIENGIPFEI